MQRKLLIATRRRGEIILLTGQKTRENGISPKKHLEITGWKQWNYFDDLSLDFTKNSKHFIIYNRLQQ